ncbi:low temperature requirement a protein [Diplodia corticola]|uniref:Low temperature requirement a protein n=1 Tax=Diplodia corticola TaxID=236234 RepID=A0A1J9RRZ3_9PEZI|nr:low temperature requirement a protein [Diplodia corticola]OJD35315.1 low temperature requirement a protein [Diplodia corticola]
MAAIKPIWRRTTGPLKRSSPNTTTTTSSTPHTPTPTRFHHLVPLLESPCAGADYASAVFAQRHEANPNELCFDLLFVANLATFTAYHTVDDSASLAAYVGFFAILWATWFQITLHDVRFARDSVYERACKVLQFGAFVGLALAGSKFEPVEDATSGKKGGEGRANYRVLCWVLVGSRGMLAAQYLLVGVAVARRRFSMLYAPLALNVGVYAAAAVIFGVMTRSFREGAEPAEAWVYWMWWVVLFVEGVSTIAISCCWRALSFKKTHLVHRMGELTLIVIGEGAIGVTKTVSKMMGKSGVDWQGTLLVGCIVLTLVFLYLTYFDNQPHDHYGTIRQQIWALLHFPFQLAVVGIGEGSQHLALARYIMGSIDKLEHKIVQYCVDEGLEGDKLVDKLSTAIKYYQLDKKPECYREVLNIATLLETLRNSTGICAPAYTATFPSADWAHDYPPKFEELITQVGSGVTMAAGMKIPMDEEPWAVLQHSWRIVYMYYWGALFVLFACLIVFLGLIRTRRARFDLFDATSIGSRVAMLSLCLVFGCLGIVARSDTPGISMFTSTLANDHRYHGELYKRFLASGGVLPTGTAMIGLTLVLDYSARTVCNHRMRKQGYEPPPLQAAHGHSDDDDNDNAAAAALPHEYHHPQRPPHHRHSSSVGSGKMILAGEVDDVDEVLAKRRMQVRESKALGFRRQEAPRPASAILLLGKFAAGLSIVRDVKEEDEEDEDEKRRNKQQRRPDGARRSSSGATLTNEPEDEAGAGLRRVQSSETGYMGHRYHSVRDEEQPY